MDVSDVLRDRMAEPRGLDRMAALSALAHVAIIGAVMMAPRGWLTIEHAPPPTVMTISLTGGNDGPQNGGMTNIGGKAIQTETPPEAKPEPVRPPAAETPAMTVPIPQKTPVKPAPQVKQAPDNARSRTPTKGPEPREGSTIAETGARGQGFGLSTSGGVGTGAVLDVADFCCPEYITAMIARIQSNWGSHAEVARVVVVKYTILRNGMITAAEVERSSGYTQLDLGALRAVVQTRQLQPLPAQYPNPTLPVHLTFEYTR